MKKIIGLSCIILTLIIALSACGKNDTKKIKIPSFEEFTQKYKNAGYDIPTEFQDEIEDLSNLSEEEKTKSIVDSLQFKDYLDFVKDIKNADWYVGTRANNAGIKDDVYQYNFELKTKESAKKLYEYLLDGAAEGKEAFVRKDHGDSSSAIYCASTSMDNYDIFGYTNFIYLNGNFVVQMKNVWDDYQNRGIQYDHAPQKMLEDLGLNLIEENDKKKEDTTESTIKKITFEELEQTFKAAEYIVETSNEELTDEEISQGMTSFRQMEGIHYKDDDIADTVTIIYSEFTNKDMALKFYNYLLEEEYSGQLKKIDNTSIAKAIYEDTGTTIMATCKDNIVIMFFNNWDDYNDADLIFDHKPKRLFENLLV